jgi:hypothetical protein
MFFGQIVFIMRVPVFLRHPLQVYTPSRDQGYQGTCIDTRHTDVDEQIENICNKREIEETRSVEDSLVRD